MLYTQLYQTKSKGEFKVFKNISDWIIYDDYCLIRIKKGGNIENINDRICFIEKIPRVQLPDNMISHGWDGNRLTEVTDNFYITGNKGYLYESDTKDYDEKSVKWCDSMIELLGWDDLI